MRSDLLKKIAKERGYTLKRLSNEAGIKKTALYRKLTGITEFTRIEIERIAKVLNLTNEEIFNIFFAKVVA